MNFSVEKFIKMLHLINRYMVNFKNFYFETFYIAPIFGIVCSSIFLYSDLYYKNIEKRRLIESKNLDVKEDNQHVEEELNNFKEILNRGIFSIIVGIQCGFLWPIFYMFGIINTIKIIYNSINNFLYSFYYLYSWFINNIIF
jgi:hypothetical protein